MFSCCCIYPIWTINKLLRSQSLAGIVAPVSKAGRAAVSGVWVLAGIPILSEAMGGHTGGGRGEVLSTDVREELGACEVSSRRRLGMVGL